MRAYKFLRRGRVAPFSGVVWPEPVDGTAGDWVDSSAQVSCISGVHACRVADLPYWTSDELWVVEIEGPVVAGARKLIATRGRLCRRVDSWTRDAAAAFAEDCAWRLRGLASATLRAEGDDESAASLDACTSLALLEDVAQGVAARSTDVASLVVQYTADAAHWTVAGDLVAVPLIAAIAASDAAERRLTHDIASDAFASERASQADWFVRTFGLVDDPPAA